MNRLSAVRAAPDYPILTLRGGRSALVDLVREVRHLLRPAICAGAINALADMITATRPSDWTSGDTEPCCYMGAAELALSRGVPASSWRRYEAQLSAAGLIERRTAANGARSRWRGTGIYFTPLMAQIGRLLDLKEQADQVRREHAHLRGARSIARRHLRIAIEALTELGAALETVQGLLEARDAWPSAEALHRLTLDDLRQHVTDAESLCREANRIAENLEKTSGGPLNFERCHIQDTTQEKNLSGNASVSERSAGKPAHDNFDSATPKGFADCREKKYGAASDARNGQFRSRLTPQRLFDLASPEMQDLLLRCNPDPAQLSLYDFTCAAYERLPRLGLRSRLWDKWAEEMSEEDLMLCVLITDARRTDPETPVISPGGYMQGMIRAHQLGRLNITGSLIGLNERRLAEEGDEP